MTGRDTSLVSVVVPAWNAQATLPETLMSVASQTYRNLEILMVDDGSDDSTGQVAAEFCRSDPRARLIRKENGGVASARNRGIEEARGAWIAPIDADDFWHPEKLERQVRLFERSASSVGLVYNWFRKIDRDGIVVEPPFAPLVEGRVLRDHLKWNFIGNGSTTLIRAKVLKDIRYSSALRAAGNQGCEDYLLQLQIAARWEFACVPAFLTGYRTNPRAMSSDVDCMVRSHVQMYRILHDSLPASERRDVDRQLARHLAAHGLLELRRGRLKGDLAALASAMGKAPAQAVAESASRVRRSLQPADRSASDPLVGRPFFSLSPEDGAPAAAASAAR